MISQTWRTSITSANRTAESISTSDFYYMLSIPEAPQFTHVVVERCSIPMSMYLIENGYNTFSLVENGVPTTITVAYGDYDRNSFMDYLSTLLTQQSPNHWTYTITIPDSSIGPETNKYTYSVAGNAGSQPQFVFTTNLYQVMGFNPNSTNTFVANNLVSVNQTDLSKPWRFYIHSDISKTEPQSILAGIYTASTPNQSVANLEVEGLMIHARQLSGNKSNKYRFVLTDENQENIDLNGIPMTIDLLIFRYENPMNKFMEQFPKLMDILLALAVSSIESKQTQPDPTIQQQQLPNQTIQQTTVTSSDLLPDASQQGIVWPSTADQLKNMEIQKLYS